VAEAGQDQWAAWLAHRRHGGDSDVLRRQLKFLGPIRDQVIANAALAPGDVAVDVGCGDGLIAFAAASQVGPSGSVIFTDISADLLNRCRELAAEAGIEDRCRFVRAAASDLSAIEDGRADAVTVRSVLIYEPDKAAAFAEFHRVLRPGGRLSLFEPINRPLSPGPPGRLHGCDAGPVADLAAKVRAVYESIQPPGSDPMLDFDDRDLLRLAEQAGFEEIHLQLHIDIRPLPPTPWEAVLRRAGNPRVPTLAKATQQRRRRAVAYLWAIRPAAARQQPRAG
jgi:arsenite methyltransferase